MAGFGPILNCYSPKTIQIVIRRSFKENRFLNLIKEQANSNQSFLMIGHIGLLSFSKIIYRIFILSRKLMVVLTTKKI